MTVILFSGTCRSHVLRIMRLILGTTILLPDIRHIKGLKVAFSETLRGVGASNIKMFHKKDKSMHV